MLKHSTILMQLIFWILILPLVQTIVILDLIQKIHFLVKMMGEMTT